MGLGGVEEMRWEMGEEEGDLEGCGKGGKLGCGEKQGGEVGDQGGGGELWAGRTGEVGESACVTVGKN